MNEVSEASPAQAQPSGLERLVMCSPDVFMVLLNRVVPRIDAGGVNPIDEELHHCEYTLYRERERIHAEFKAIFGIEQSDT